MEYIYAFNLGQAGEVDVEIDIDDCVIEEYAEDTLGMTADPEQWTHDNLSVEVWLDNEDDPENTLNWVLKNVDHETIIAALEAELRGA